MTIVVNPYPETEALEARIVEFSESYRQFRITSDDDLRKAKLGLDTIAAMKADPDFVDLIQACTEADRLHDRLVARRDKVLKPLNLADKYLRGEIASYLDTQEQRHKALLTKLQEAADVKRKQEEAELPPWEEAPAHPPTPIALAPAPQAVSGLSRRRLPSRTEVIDFKALVHGAAKDDSLLKFLSPNLPALTEIGRAWGKKITEERIPGVRVVDDKKTVSRR
jgi:hypothetical protein